ncbi:hypothetical protein A1QO_19310 [Vibrio genomosp. F10 str. ZF-129]|uniref:diguanylate cyclase n=1 Tax=Vibrio genomosp. F10 str. ZF-129 TaxID=1187848 RepID=A0A1E5BH83_9VIBR|nr:diguanylate cyclase [Vibrio genomosp. F10]OEE35967.1 hypothetical protein A1QO_19310 [Vibrio genomosp. F10 str. ZF-129]
MSKKFISKKIRWVGSITVVIVLFIFTIDVFLFRFNVASTPIEPVTLSPEQQLADSAIGRELVSIRPLIDESPALAKKAIHALLLSNKSQDLTTIEQIYVLLLRRDIAISERQELAATEINQQLSHLANQKNIPWLQALLEIEQAEKALKTDQIEQGIANITNAMNIAESNHAEFLLLRAYNTAGALYNASNQLKSSQLYFYKGIKLGKKYPTDEYNGRLYNNLGLLHAHLAQWAKALEYLKLADNQFRASHNVTDDRLMVVLLNQSYVYTKFDKPKEARVAYEKARSYLNLESKNYYQILMLKAKARILMVEKNYQQAVVVATQCRDFTQPVVYRKQSAICGFILAKSLIGLGNYDEAMEHLNRSIDTFYHIDHQRWLIRTYQTKAEIYEQLGDTAQALSIYKEYNAKERAQFTNEIYALEFAFGTQEVQQERDLLNVQNQLSELQLNEEKLRFKILFIWIVVAILVLAFVIRRSIAIKNHNIELQNYSYQDPLTGANNRRYYQKEIESGSVLNRSSQYRVVLIDLDWFKNINDQYGHDVGDQVLIKTAKRLKKEIRADELLIRWGGEEFLCLIKETDDIHSRVESLLKIVNASPYQTDAGELNITVSVGVSYPNSLFSLRQDTAPFVVADKCLYQSKKNGRNQTSFPV